MSDDEKFRVLCERLRESDRNAFESLFRMMRMTLLRYVNSIVRDEMTAHDLVQDVFVSVWSTRKTLEVDKPLRPFLLTMARNRAYRHLRDTRRHHAKHEEIRMYQSVENGMDDQTEARTDSRAIDAHLQRWLLDLPERQREALSLSRFHDLSHREIAALMGISARTVNNHIVRALETLSERLSALESEHDRR